MSWIDELISKYCPKGVEFSALGDLCTIETGKLNANAAVEGGDYPFFTTAQEIGQIDTWRWDTEALLVAGNANVGDVKHYIGRFEAYQRTYVLTSFSSCLSVRFLFYYLQSSLQHYLQTKTNIAAMTYIVLGTLKGFKIPVPPLEVQQEIVRILDKFTELEAELEAELDARHKQYEHYLNSLTHPFSEDRILKPGWTEAKMGDLCRIEKGRTAIQKAVPGPYPLVTTARDRGTAADFQFDGDAACIPLISSRGHGVASIARIYHQSGRFALGNILAAALPYDPNTLSAEFLRAYLQSRKDFILVPLMRGGANVSLTIDSLKRLKVHFPSIDEQRRIVQILRKFESLIGDSPFGIPAEIAARRKQYEYYRDRLLTFKELAA